MTKPPNTKPCPECDAYIPVTAVKCRCGWVSRESRPEHIACAFAGCPHSATIRARTKTGWANVCPTHDAVLVQKSADEYCKSRGLDTPAKQREWVIKNLKIPALRRSLEYIEAKPVEEPEAEEIPF